jgi:hypothetical protein
MKRFLPVNLVFALWAAFSVLAACTPPVSDLPPDSPSSYSSSPPSPYDPELSAWRTASWTPFTVNDSIAGFAWGAGDAGEMYVAVSYTGVIAYSRDGDIWEAALLTAKPQLPYSGEINLNAVAYGGGAFVAVGNDGKIAHSRDGISWLVVEGITGFIGADIRGIAYGKPEGGTLETFVAVGAGGKIACSSDGANWSDRSAASTFSGVQLNDVCFGGGRFYVIGNGGHRAWSDNPANMSWQHYESKARDSGTYPEEKNDPGFPFFGNNLNKIAYGTYGSDASGNPVDGIALVFTEWGGRRIAIATHDNFSGSGWDADLDTGYFGNNTIRGIAYGGGYFVAVGTSSMIGFWPSADKDNHYNRYWRALPFRDFLYWEITALAALNGRFYAGSIGGKIGYSK